MTNFPSTHSTLQLCPLCNEPLSQPNECNKCDWVREVPEPGRPERQTQDIAALALSIVPGAGHIFKGHQMLGWLLMLVGVPVVLVLAFAFTMFFGWLMIPTYWIGVGADAFFRRDLRKPAPAVR